jgi:glycosyltransferase involved in cell wall biosynthesis
MISVIIPSYKDKYLNKTMKSILENFTGDFEIVPVIDGYLPEEPLIKDSRIKPVYIGENRGMREAINRGVFWSSGEYIMRSDEHCMFGNNFNGVILDTIQDNWIVTTLRYFLDPIRWKVMDKRPVTYEKLVISDNPDKKKFSGVEWVTRAKKRKYLHLDETMAMQGSCWVMKRSWWDKVIVKLESNGYGTHYSDSIEMVFKTWKAGGKLMVNKNTWFAHKHRNFKRSHHYSTEKAMPEWEYALDTWKDDYMKIKEAWGI